MAFEDLTLDQLYTLASEHNITGRSNMDKEALIEALEALDVRPPDEISQVSGFQEGVDYPLLPQTADEFKSLLPNPDRPAELQSAPSQEQLNPHLFGPQGRL